MQVDENGRLVIDPEDLDTRYLKLDGLYPMTGDLDVGANSVFIDDLALTRISAWLLRVHQKGNLGSYRGMEFGELRAHTSFRLYDDNSKLLGPEHDTRHGLFQSYSGGYLTVMDMYSGLIDIPRAGDIIPVSTKTKSLGSAAKYWNQLFVDAILCSNSIDMHPTSGDAVIYFKHDGAANEASLRYDKVNKRLELWIDGAIIGYCNAALGWVNGAP